MNRHSYPNKARLFGGLFYFDPFLILFYAKAAGLCFPIDFFVDGEEQSPIIAQKNISHLAFFISQRNESCPFDRPIVPFRNVYPRRNLSLTEV